MNCNGTCETCANTYCDRFTRNCTEGCVDGFEGHLCKQRMTYVILLSNTCSLNKQTNKQTHTHTHTHIYIYNFPKDQSFLVCVLFLVLVLVFLGVVVISSVFFFIKVLVFLP